ncbi:YihY/virulence factor BrkB family protein [Methylacidiphilum caldifontis]|uniref:YihY/virulence factor BrkB family protein n=1 Tax=Methylacidiphilum caldifontis TaxID=2795386 RepID=UPI001A8CDD3D|nr:YihY/virulence factor BrkB family protein [Methylacidiphilum caldifontis]QSR88108.1 YihY/virulence factor BrkB family protein [Methylacidiphilum caldifontis]
MRFLFSLFKGAIGGWIAHNGSKMGAALSCYILFSVIPLILVLVSIASLFVDPIKVNRQIIFIFLQILGEESINILKSYQIHAPVGFWSNPQQLSMVMFSLLFGASGAFIELQKSLNEIWEIVPGKEAGLWHAVQKQFFSFLIIFLLGLLLLLFLLLSTTFLETATFLREFSPELKKYIPEGIQLASFLAEFLIFSLLYKILPDSQIQFKDVWFGALFSALLIFAGKSLLWISLRKSAVASIYGAGGSVIMLLLWIFYCSQIFFFGAELTREYALLSSKNKENRKESKSQPYLTRR